MGKIIDINGPIVSLYLPESKIGEQVRIGELGLVGEIISRNETQALAQVYERTDGLRPGEIAEGMGYPLSVELGPGLLGGIFDGVQRPLDAVRLSSGDRMDRGVMVNSLDREKSWLFTPNPELEIGKHVAEGTVLGTVQETESIEHRILLPPLLQGELMDLASEQEYRIDQNIAHVRLNDGDVKTVSMFHRWPVRSPRPYGKRDHALQPLLTGQRILDTFYPLLKGGKAAIPGPFGAGKTMLQQQIARWCNAEIVIYVGCGERGNELTDVLEFMPELTDPHTGRPLMERTLLVANTSNMPVVAREASVYVGITIAEYFRDQGYDVVMVADSTSRWAEALREVSGRLGQMPVEEGYPAYLGSRLASFYERAGRVETLAGEHGSVTLIGAVSPPGGDFSEPVTSHTKEIIQTFWALSKELADARHYPAIDWLESFSGYIDGAAHWWAENIDPAWQDYRKQALEVLTDSEELQRIVNLVGVEALSGEQRWTLESASLLKEGLLQQSAIDEVDSYASPRKQFLLLALIMDIHRHGMRLVAIGVPVRKLLELPLLSAAKRWKGQYAEQDISQLQHQLEQLPSIFERLGAHYQQTETPEVS